MMSMSCHVFSCIDVTIQMIKLNSCNGLYVCVYVHNTIRHTCNHFTALLIECFYSGRPYKMILQRLKLVHGINKR